MTRLSIFAEKKRMPLIAPSLLAANFYNLEKDLAMINASEADWLHIDVMDGVFVPNISFGEPVIKAVKKHCTKPLDVHLMIVQPERYIEHFVGLGASVISIHQEACVHLHRTIDQIKSLGCKASVVLNPSTPISVLEEILPELDMVLLMSVNPGFGGQKFIYSTLKKVEKLKAQILAAGLNTLIEIDGGVNEETGKQLIDAGADVLVAGNAVFAAPNPLEVIENLKAL